MLSTKTFLVSARRNLKTLSRIIIMMMMYGNSKVMFFTIAQVFEGNSDDEIFCRCRQHCIDFLFICPVWILFLVSWFNLMTVLARLYKYKFNTYFYVIISSQPENKQRYHTVNEIISCFTKYIPACNKKLLNLPYELPESDHLGFSALLT